MYTLAFYNNPTALIIVLILVLLLFGGQKLPELMKGLGSGIKEFKKGMTEDEVHQQDAQALAEKERLIRTRVEEEMRREGKI